MQELEKKTYNFSVQGIGFIKSIDKNYPGLEMDTQELKQYIGAVSLKFIAAMDSKENDDFANNLRECHNKAMMSSKQLKKLDKLKENTLKTQKNDLIREAEEITEQLDKILEKLIY